MGQKMQKEWQTEQTLIRLLLQLEQSDLGLHCLLRIVWPNTSNVHSSEFV